VHADAALTDEEKAFVMDNFDLFAAHFEPRAAESRRLLDDATTNFLQGEIGKLRTRINALEDKSDARSKPAEHWLHPVRTAAAELQDGMTRCAVVRLKLAIAEAARNMPARPETMTQSYINDDSAWIKYQELAEWAMKSTLSDSDDDSSDDSGDDSGEDTDDDSEDEGLDVEEALEVLARHGFALKPRARKAYGAGPVPTIARKIRRRRR
jgi:hypothetical protein